ncbi:MAG: class I SAM-dependent methyltransferase [Planctomycetes bacterium]|nr:class I SAM-dependent methyltransferase [Planctomycetota bacterium]MCB9903913.1 class I SAM-dependent methyltransferase [Planctomycetota bacterium]
MNQRIATRDEFRAPAATKRTWLARMVLARLSALQDGVLELHESGHRHTLGTPAADGLRARLDVHDARFWKAVARHGSIGAGEAYAEGWWSSPAPQDVVRLMVRNHSVLEGVDGGLAKLAAPFRRFTHFLRRNTQAGSRENISAHYDFSNEFFALFLDDTLTYSCGIYEREDSTLREASIAKIDRLCRKLDLQPGDHLLEIGTGWGAFALHAAREYGCRVTTTTISREQHDFAAERFAASGVGDRIELLLADYRTLEGQYDKLVSVEMIEAVGHQFYDTFHRRCMELLKPNGRMAIQAITIADQHYERAKHAVDFIQAHIFPGSCIPSVTALLSSATRASDLKLVHLEDIGTHYVPTLAQWRRNLRENQDRAKALGFDDRVLRLWEFYFVYCEGGFAERHISDVQMVLSRPAERGAPILPALAG